VSIDKEISVLESIRISNYKSIEKVDLPLGRVNVFIGENGAGKSNILEAIALAGAASAGKLDNEFLSSRGIRVTQPQLMRSAFSEFADGDPIEAIIHDDNGSFISYEITNENAAYSQWQCSIAGRHTQVDMEPEDFLAAFKAFLKSDNNKSKEDLKYMKKMLMMFMHLIDGVGKDIMQKSENIDNRVEPEPVDFKVPKESEFGKFLASELIKISEISRYLSGFIIFSPENSSLRLFEREGQIEPLGINGEGLLKLLSVLSESREHETLGSIKSSLKLLGWFNDFDIVVEPGNALGRMEIKDRYLAAGKRYFDQKSSNEGFLFLTFYFALFSSNLTPSFFAIDNIDASLNPKLCQELMRQLVKLSHKHDKQVLLTTHNPAVLDGLNLDDDSQRLFVVSRGRKGQTRVKRIEKPKAIEGAPPVRLSEAFLRGSLGGLPKGF
jgi:predicted ATPase